MVTPDELRRRKEEIPFRPFRIYLCDGRHFDIPDLTWYLVGEAIMKVGVAPEDDPKATVAERMEWVPYELVEKLEWLATPTAAA
jgi:hypothetical protein